MRGSRDGCQEAEFWPFSLPFWIVLDLFWPNELYNVHSNILSKLWTEFSGVPNVGLLRRVLTGADDMNESTKSSVETLDLDQLEGRIDELVDKISALTNENDTLRQQHTGLVKERARLVEKTETARSRVEAMITRLKAMERE